MNPLDRSSTAIELAEKVNNREISPLEVVKDALELLNGPGRELNAVITVCEHFALQHAANLQARLARSENCGPLAGVPIVVKDNISTQGVRTTCGSRILERYVPPYDATVVTRLRAAGAILVAKTNCDEFAMGSSNENSAFGPVKNPWDVGRVPGGSSGGSAAAVAAGLTPAGLGSDTGGSIRQPASFCGVVGVKPTYGRVSRYGLVAYASSLDQIGPFTRTVEDAALMLQIIAGADPMDSTCLSTDLPNLRSACSAGIKGLRLGLPREYFADEIDSEVKQAVRAAASKLTELGASVEECSLPMTSAALPAYYIIAPAEASSNLARFDGVRYGHRASSFSGPIQMTVRSRTEGFGEEVKQRIMVGTYALSAGYYDAYYKRAQQVRTLIRRDFARAFEKFDALLTPTAPTVAFQIGEKSKDPMAMKLADLCTLPINMAGLPALSLPCGFSGGLPIGLQIVAPPLREDTMFQVAGAYEEAAEWNLQRPTIRT